MKRFCCLGICLLLLRGCGDKKEEEAIEENNSSNSETNVTIEDSYRDDNPITLGMYLYNGSSEPRELISEYSSSCVGIADIGSFEVFLTRDDSISSDNFQTVWQTYYDDYQEIDNYRIGYYIEFNLSDGTSFNKLLLDPDDGDEFYDYIQIYLYDDVHQEIGSWYSHVTSDEYSDKTILSSIKLTASSDWEMIKSPITLTAFSYDSDDDFKDGKYRGNSSYTITIKCE